MPNRVYCSAPNWVATGPSTGCGSSPRNGRSGSASGAALRPTLVPVGEGGERRLQLLVGKLQLAGELGGQVAALVDGIDARRLPADGSVELTSRGLGVRDEHRELGVSRREIIPGGAECRQRLTMLREPTPIELGDLGHHAVGPANRANVVDAK